MTTIDHYFKNFAKKKIILWRIWGDLELKGLESAWGIPRAPGLTRLRT
jgi:hypothetical protein